MMYVWKEPLAQIPIEPSARFIKPGFPIVLRKPWPKSPTGTLDVLMVAEQRYQTIQPGILELESFGIRFSQFSLSQRIRPRWCHNHYTAVITRSNSGDSLRLTNSTDSLLSPPPLDTVIFPQGAGLGSIIFNHLLHWAKENYPAASIPSIKLSSVDEGEAENVKRRNALYENIGLLNKGCQTTAELTPKIDTKGFEIHYIEDFLNHIMGLNGRLLRANKSFNL